MPPCATWLRWSRAHRSSSSLGREGRRREEHRHGPDCEEATGAWHTACLHQVASNQRTHVHERPWESRNGARKADRQTCGLQRSRDEHDARKEWSLSCDSLREADKQRGLHCTCAKEGKAWPPLWQSLPAPSQLTQQDTESTNSSLTVTIHDECAKELANFALFALATAPSCKEFCCDPLALQQVTRPHTGNMPAPSMTLQQV